MKNKKLFDFHLGSFTIRITKEIVDIESEDKNWKVQFSKRTKEYATIFYFAEKKQEKALVNVARLLYLSKDIVGDPIFLKHFQKMLKEYFAEANEPKGVNPEEDEKILREQEELHG